MKHCLIISNASKKAETSQLHLIYVGLHKPLSVETFSRCLKEFLRLCGIDTSLFTENSTRPLSAHKSEQVGLSLPATLKRRQWTNKTACETFYNKPIMDNSQEVLKEKTALPRWLQTFGVKSTEISRNQISEFYNGAKLLK